jgi:peptidoglycan/LPS O-acetylase OafA/YrhL
MPSRYRTDFVPDLEACRGIAAVLVAGAHAAYSPVIMAGKSDALLKIGGYWSTSGLTVNNSLDAACLWILRALLNSTGAVLFFFVLSGFVLAGSLHRSGLSLRAAAEFLAARVFRIYPAIIATVSLFTLWYFATGKYIDIPGTDLQTVLRNMALLIVHMNGVMWTMQVELIAIPVILFAFAVGRINVFLALALAVALLGASYYDWYLNLVPAPGIPRPKYLYAFVLGVAVFFGGRWLVDRVNSALLMILGCLVFFTANIDISSYYWRELANYQHLIEVVAAALMVAALAYGRPSIFSRILTMAPLRLLGRVSYSFYLLHPLTLTVVWKMPELLGGVVESGVPLSVLALALWAVTTAATLPLALLSYVWVEKPGIRLGRRLVTLLSDRRRTDLSPVLR